jgi:hypothetical protein
MARDELGVRGRIHRWLESATQLSGCIVRGVRTHKPFTINVEDGVLEDLQRRLPVHITDAAASVGSHDVVSPEEAASQATP